LRTPSRGPLLLGDAGIVRYTTAGEPVYGARPRLAVSSGGDVGAIWLSLEDDGPILWTRRRSASAGWGVLSRASRPWPGPVTQLDVVFARDGSALVVANLDTDDDVWGEELWCVRIHTDGTQEEPQHLEAAAQFSLAHDEAGLPILGWSDADGVWLRSFDGAWQPAERIAGPVEGWVVGAPHLALAGETTVAVWLMHDLRSSRHPYQALRGAARVDGAWSEVTGLGLAWWIDPVLVVGGGGRVVAATGSYVGAYTGARSVQYSRNAGWVSLDGDVAATTEGEVTSLAMSGQGQALVLGVSPGAWWSKRLVGETWTELERIDVPGPPAVDQKDASDLAVSPGGVGIAAWRVGSNLFTGIFTPTSGWRPREVDAEGDVLDHRVEVDSSGRGVVVWAAYDGERVGIWALDVE
jgi:hypothetical protein